MKYFVDTTGDGVGYVVEAYSLVIDGAAIAFVQTNGDPIVVLSAKAYYSVEPVTDEDVEYIEESIA